MLASSAANSQPDCSMSRLRRQAGAACWRWWLSRVVTIPAAGCWPVLPAAGIGSAHQTSRAPQGARRQAAAECQSYARRNPHYPTAQIRTDAQHARRNMKFGKRRARGYSGSDACRTPASTLFFLRGSWGLALSEVERWLPGTKLASSRMRPLAGRSRSSPLPSGSGRCATTSGPSSSVLPAWCRSSRIWSPLIIARSTRRRRCACAACCWRRIAYFILPADLIPDIIAGLGFADDAALLTAVVGLVASHITPTHRAAAARALDKELPATP